MVDAKKKCDKFDPTWILFEKKSIFYDKPKRKQKVDLSSSTIGKRFLFIVRNSVICFKVNLQINF